MRNMIVFLVFALLACSSAQLFNGRSVQTLQRRDIDTASSYYLQLSVTNGSNVIPVHPINNFTDVYSEFTAGTNLLRNTQTLYSFVLDGTDNTTYTVEASIGISLSDSNDDIFPTTYTSGGSSYTSLLLNLGGTSRGLHVTAAAGDVITHNTTYGVVYNVDAVGNIAVIDQVAATLITIGNTVGCTFTYPNAVNQAINIVACGVVYNRFPDTPTTRAVTTGTVTTGRSLTSGRITTGIAPVTTGVAPITSGVAPVTTGVAPITSGVAPVTTGVAPVTTGVALVTTGVAPVTTGVAPITSGVAPVTTGVAPVTTGVAPITTGVATPVTSGANAITSGVAAPVTTGITGTMLFVVELQGNCNDFNSSEINRILRQIEIAASLPSGSLTLLDTQCGSIILRFYTIPSNNAAVSSTITTATQFGGYTVLSASSSIVPHLTTGLSTTGVQEASASSEDTGISQGGLIAAILIPVAIVTFIVILAVLEILRRRKQGGNDEERGKAVELKTKEKEKKKEASGSSKESESSGSESSSKSGSSSESESGSDSESGSEASSKSSKSSKSSASKSSKSSK